MPVAAHDLLEIASLSGSTITTAWVKPISGSLYTFTAMVDTPDSYVGQARRVVAVNAAESDLEFIEHVPSATVVSETSFGQAANAGSNTGSFSRADHTHGTPPALVPASTVVSETSYGQSVVVGVDSEFARQDHTHGTQHVPASYNSRHAGLIGANRIYHVANCVNGGTTSVYGTAMWFTADYLWATPFVMPNNGGYIATVSIYCTTTLNKHCRLGIYKATSRTDLYPHDLVLDCGTYTFTGGGLTFYHLYLPPLALDPTEIYYFVFLADQQFASYTLVQNNTSNLLGYSWAGTDFYLNPNVGIVASKAYGALPDPFTAGGSVWGGGSAYGSMYIWYSTG